MDADGAPHAHEETREGRQKTTAERHPDSLATRIRSARRTAHPEKKAPDITGSLSGLGAALRIGSELLAALIVGLGAGYLLDEWLGTRPWMMVLFFFLGSAAGVLNVYRAASGFAFMGSMGKEDADAKARNTREREDRERE